MAHNLNFNNGKASFVAKGETAWHGLGTYVKEAMTSDECIKLAGLDYDVIKTDIYANIGGQPHLIDGKFATYRSDTKQVLGTVGNRYEIVQNWDAFKFFDSITGAKEAIYETAGALGNGEKIFITAKMPGYIRINGTDDISVQFVILTNTHDGSGSIIAGVTPVRIVCSNTLNAALKGLKNRISIRHTSNVNARLEEAHKLMGISNEYITQVNELFNVTAKKIIDDKTAKRIIEQVFQSEKTDSKRVENIREAVWVSYQAGIGQEKILGTGWGLYNGFTHYLDHVRNYRDEDVKFESIISGDSALKANKALELILQA